MLSKPRRLLLLTLALFAVLLVGLGFGAVRLRPDEILGAMFGSGEADPIARTIVLQLRLPRALLAACVGAGLAAGGAAYQGLFRNPLAEPFVVGAASGAALGATLVIVSGWRGPFPQFVSPIPLGAFLGALAAAGLTFGLSAVLRADSVVALLLTGVAVGTLLNAAVWVLMIWNNQELGRIISWMMGSLVGRGWSDLRHVWPWLAIGVGGLWLLARPLDALAEGEETARALGLRVRLATGLVLTFTSLATAAAVAAGGIIGFVGLIAPHVARRLVGATNGWVIPASALIGGTLLVLADTAARTVTAPVELPVGVVTAALGGPFFLYLLGGRRL